MVRAYLMPSFRPAARYLKSVAPPEIDPHTIFAGVLPFVCLQLIDTAPGPDLPADRPLAASLNSHLDGRWRLQQLSPLKR